LDGRTGNQIILEQYICLNGDFERKGIFVQEYQQFFSCPFPAEESCTKDHLAFCGKFIPQSGKNLPTFEISPLRTQRGRISRFCLSTADYYATQEFRK
jgi:hypothetical protein